MAAIARIWIAFVCLILCLGLSVAGGQQVQVSGQVSYQSGAPVQHAHVVFWSYAGGSMIQPTTETDEHGNYTLTLRLNDDGVISASKQDSGFPDAELAFYDPTRYPSLRIIRASRLEPIYGVDLKFNQPQKTIRWKIVDADSGNPVQGARADVQMVHNKEITGSVLPDRQGDLTIVIPYRPMQIRIRAKGYVDQMFTEVAPPPVNGESFRLTERTVSLHHLR